MNHTRKRLGNMLYKKRVLCPMGSLQVCNMWLEDVLSNGCVIEGCRAKEPWDAVCFVAVFVPFVDEIHG